MEAHDKFKKQNLNFKKMKLAAIYCVWDDYEILQSSIKNMFGLVDAIIVVCSKQSNYGEISELPYLFFWSPAGWECFLSEPKMGYSSQDNERAKRNFGLDKARELGYTHFIMMDADEFYEPSEFLKEKERIEREDLGGTVCRVKCYFKAPTLTIGYDVTLIPFIHKITPQLKFEWNRAYPFAWDKTTIRIDPTRQMNINYGVIWSDITMHHYSWVRKDIKKKIRNSTARQNLEQSTIVRDYVNAKEGYYCEFYKATLEACENLFNIPDIIDENVS